METCKFQHRMRNEEEVDGLLRSKRVPEQRLRNWGSWPIDNLGRRE